jgi:KRAB domain-containing zinc finger protein
LFTTQSKRKRHERIHNEERPFSCGLCDKSFKSRDSRKKHQQVHKWEHQFSCNILESSGVFK